MSLVLYLSSLNPVNCGQFGSRASSVNSQMQHNLTSALHPHPNFAYRQKLFKSLAGVSCAISHRKSCCFFKDSTATKSVKTDDHEVSSMSEEESTVDFDWGDEDDEGSPWEGAIVYRRNPSITHVESCTTLERLGLGKLSSEISRSRASAMGLRVTKDVKDYLQGTPVLVSVDITRKKHKLRLDGIIRTVLTLSCNRCGELAAESVFSNFSLLLSEEPVEEPDIINMGVIYGEEELKRSAGTADNEEDGFEEAIDWDDKLYFPSEEKEIDISKHIRDMIHVEITINAVCDRQCKGLCLNCGKNLNTSVCICSEQTKNGVAFGPLGKIRKQMQNK